MEILTLLISIAFFIFILFILVVVHEFGHYLAAVKTKTLVEEFGFGIPPRMWGKKYKETLWSLNWIPLGGFVKLYGDGVAGESTHIDPKLKDRAFVNKKPLEKILVIVGGVVFNILFAWLLYSILFTSGTRILGDGVSFNSIVENSPAQVAGLKPNDIIINVVYEKSTKSINSILDFKTVVTEQAGKQITITVKREGSLIKIPVTPRANPPAGQGALGVGLTQATVDVKYPFYTAPYYAGIETFKNLKIMTYEILSLPAKFFAKKSSNGAGGVEVAGPIGIFNIFNEIAKEGIKPILNFMIVISLNLAVFNMLPIPALDGGRLLFALYELVSRKRANAVLEAKINTIGFMLLIAMSIYVAYKDIIKLAN